MRRHLRVAGAVALAVALIVPVSASAAEAAPSPVPDGLVAWGNNTFAGAGVGSTVDPLVEPTALVLPDGRTAAFVDSGQANGAAIATDGTAWAWGDNGSGALGIGTQDDDPHPSPVAVQLPDGVTLARISVGSGFMIAVDTQGDVWGWGVNWAGEIGNGQEGIDQYVLTPQRIPLPDGVTVTAVATASNSSFALTSTGALYSWGGNQVGQLGNGSSSGDAVPTPALVVLPADAVVTGIAVRGNSVSATTEDGRTLVWGDNTHANLLLTDQTELFTSTPQEPAPLPGTGLAEFVLGATFSLARGTNGVVYSWGANDHGQLGDGTTDPSAIRAVPAPVPVPTGVTFAAFWPGAMAVYATTTDGIVYAWGLGGEGLLGDGQTDDVLTPTVVPLSRDHRLEIVSYNVLTVSARITLRPSIFTDTLPQPTVGVPYSQRVEASGSPDIAFAVAAGALPAGLSLDPSSGVVSGTPTVVGDTQVTISATNSAGTASRTFAFQVAAAVAPAAGPGSRLPGELADTGSGDGLAVWFGAVLLLAAGVFVCLSAARNRTRRGAGRPSY